jgi:hypothetical protein
LIRDAQIQRCSAAPDPAWMLPVLSQQRCQQHIPVPSSCKGVVPLTAEERAALQKARASALEDGREWMEDAMGCGGGLDGVLEALAAEGVDGGVVGPMIQGGG